jgi:hypothetical protein
MTFRNATKWITAGAAVACIAYLSSPVRAQQDAAPPPDTAATQDQAANASSRTRQRPLGSVISSLSRSTGISIVADTPLTGLNVPAPSGEVAASDLEAQLTTITKALPSGALWAKLYLPAAASSRGYNGDALASYALAQARLFGNVGAPTTPGTIEVMGQKVSADKADSVVAALNLKPVYVILNPVQRNNGTNQANAVTPANAANWAAMNPQQRQQYAQQQAQNILNMDPQSRQQAMQSMMEQQRAVMQALMQSMTPEQRQQMFQGMRPNGRFGGGRPGGPNGAPPF